MHTLLTLRFPIEILEIQKKKYRKLSKHYYRVRLSIHNADLREVKATLKHEYPKNHGYLAVAEKMTTEDKYSLLVGDCLHAYSETIGERL